MSAVGRAWQVYRRRGMRVVLQKAAVRLFPFLSEPTPLVHTEDVVAVDWRTPHRWEAEPRQLPEDRLVVAWIMSPPGANSGGHQNIFRFIRVLEAAGHECRIYLYSVADPTTPAQVRELVDGSSSYADLAANIASLPLDGIPDDVDVIVATGWETCYPSYRDASNARRLYFVQDFEPYFTAVGTQHVLAENTYRFRFRGITAGGWLEHKLRHEYGMPAVSYDFGADPTRYSVVEHGRREAVFFYARPETPRRGFELGVMALELLHRQRPDAKIILAGQDLRGIALPFPYENPGVLQVGELNGLYNQCAAGLVLSFTNMSLLPLELLAAGVIPVVNDAPNNRLVSDNTHIAYTAPSPAALAERLIAILDAVDQPELAAAGAESVRTSSWEAAGRQFLDGFERSVR